MKKLSILFLTLLLVCFTSFAKDIEGPYTSLNKSAGLPLHSLLNINEVAHWIDGDALSAHNPNTGGNGIYFPRLTYGAGIIYTDGLLWGGFVKDEVTPSLRVGGTAYTTGMMGGAILSPGVAENPDAEDVRIFRIRRDFHNADLAQDAAELEEIALQDVTDAEIAALRDQYKKDWLGWPVDKGAPFYDADGDGEYNPVINDDGSPKLAPTGDEEYDPEIHADEPGYAGADQVIWFVCNDLNTGRMFNLYGSPPMGMEMQVTFWGYKRTDALGYAVFKKYKLIYKGTDQTPANATIDSMFVAQFSDPDLGEYSDDFVGCDTTTSIAYCYNSSAVDASFRVFSLAPPSSGYDFLQGPMVSGVAGEDLNKNGVDDAADYAIFNGALRGPGFVNLPMTAFNYFAAGSSIEDPDREEYAGTEQWYNLMNGLQPRDDIPFKEADDTPVQFALSGNPVTGEGYIDGALLGPGDRRMQMISGPFEMALGDTQEVVSSFICGLGADNKSSIDVLKFNDIAVQNAYDNFFELASAPQSPNFTLTALDQTVLVNWGHDPATVSATEGQDQKGYKFEGYNVYQLPSAGATKDQGQLIATFDIVNEVTTILDRVFDQSSGQILQKPVQLGTNSGIKRSLLLTKDVFTGGPFLNGTPYFFSVTAYNYNPDTEVPIHSLETSLSIKRVIPQTADPGVKYPYETEEALEISHEGPSDGSVSVTVIDPTKVTGNTYQVVFDTLKGETVWHLDNVTTGERMLENQTNQTGDEVYLIVDGIQVKVVGPPAGVKAVQEMNQAGEIVDTAVDAYVRASLGTTGYLVENRAGALPGEGDRTYDRFGYWGMDDVEINFGEESLTWDYSSEEVHFDSTTGEAYIAPFSAYRYIFGGDKQRLFAGFWDTDGDGTYNMPLEDDGSYSWTGTNYGAPSYEPIYCWVGYDAAGNNINYDPANNAQYIADNSLLTSANTTWGGGTGEFHYPFITATLMTMYLDGATLPIGNKIMFITNKPNTMADVFTFNTSPVTYSAEQAKVDVEKINVFPNPYYGTHQNELSLQGRFVTFNHLPTKATIKIFDLNGGYVETLEKDSDSQYFEWNLQNHNGLPVASGIYIVHIDMPELGKTKILKLALIKEREFIQVY